MSEEQHTDREYELEKKLWDTLFAIQQYLLAKPEGRTDVNTYYERKLREMVLNWMNNADDLRHPKWFERQD